MGRGRSGAGKKGDSASERRYSQGHGDPGRLLHEGEGQSRQGAVDVGAFGVPTLDEFKELNKRIHDDDGHPERWALDQPSTLESCLARTRAALTPAADDVARAAAVLAHGIAQAQAFRDGNRRTAYFGVQGFLARCGYSRLSPEGADDHLLARYLNQVVDNQTQSRPTPGPEKFEKLFRRRLDRRANRS